MITPDLYILAISTIILIISLIANRKRETGTLVLTEVISSVSELPSSYMAKIYQACVYAKENKLLVKFTVNKIVMDDMTQVFIMPVEYCGFHEDDGTFSDPSSFLNEIMEK